MYYAAQDIIEYLMNTVGGGAQDGEHRALRASAQHAYRDVAYARDWLWHLAQSPLPAAVAGSNNKVFVLPPDVKNVDGLIPPNRMKVVSYITGNEFRRLENYGMSAGSPIYWTLVKCPTKPDRWQLMIAGTPAPLEPGEQYYITYRRKPAPLRYMGYEQACRNGSLTASNAAGCVKRYGTATQFPEGPSGGHPFVAEEVLGIAGSLNGTPPANAKTVVSDFLDVSENMYTAVLSGAEAWLARMLGKNVEGALTVYQRDLRLAMESDTVAPISGRRAAVDRYPEFANPPLVAGWATPASLGYYSPPGPDTGTGG
jgi:hypothetical protein